MKKINLLVALVFVAQVIFAASVTPADEIPEYWESVNGKSGLDLWKAVSARTNYGHKSIGYDPLYTAYEKTDVYPADSVGKAGKIWDMYGECINWEKGKCGTYSGVCDCYNREHSIPQSWWGGGTGGIGNDIFHVVPTDGKINGVRSNYEYGVVNGGTNWLGNKFGSAGSWSTDRKTIATDAEEVVQGTGSVFEPKPQYKGDLARGLMGTIVKWQSDVTDGNNFFSGSYTVSGYFGLTKKAVVLLMKWHREDPVSRKEIDRNNGIQQTQGNRNPFIDYPYLAEYIWGEHAGETIDMSKLMPSTDSEFVPGVSDGWRGESTPSTPVPMYGVNWSVNGETVHTDSVKENKKISALPETPVSCSSESAAFMGWTNEPISGIADEVPEVLYTKVSQFQAITEDVTFYAVFAHAEIEQGAEDVTYTYSANTNIEGWSNTATNKGQYWLLDSGKELISPEIDLSSLDTIKARLRTFGGTQFDQFAFAAGETTIGTIKVTEGGTLVNYEWINTQTLSGTSKLTFTCSNAGSNKGVGFSSVSIHAKGAGTTYSRYITICQSTEEVEVIPVEGPARKLLIGGHVYIMLDNRLYNLQGQRIK